MPAPRRVLNAARTPRSASAVMVRSARFTTKASCACLEARRVCLTAESVDLMVLRSWGPAVMDHRAATPLAESCAAFLIWACVRQRRLFAPWTGKHSRNAAMTLLVPRLSMASANAGPSRPTRLALLKDLFAAKAANRPSAAMILSVS